jgi:hypothetical protein
LRRACGNVTRPVLATICSSCPDSGLHCGCWVWSATPDETARAYTQFVLLRELVSDLDDEQLDTLLTHARGDAERFG